MRTLVLGLGNEMYGDDGVGLHVVRRLNEMNRSGTGRAPVWEDVDFLECPLSGLALLDFIVGYERLIIVDTIKKQDPETGRVRVLDAGDLRAIPGPSPHYVSVPQTLEIGRTFGLEVPVSVKVVAVEAKNIYDLGEGLTEEMERCIPAAVDEVKKLLEAGEKQDIRRRPEETGGGCATA